MPVASTHILWIDCEMTGLNCYLRPVELDAKKEFLPDRILEIAAIVTDKDLVPLDEGVEFIVKTSQKVLDSMNPWCIDQHGRTGLTASCLTSTLTMEEVDSKVTDYVSKHFPEKSMVLLAGNSVHADKSFIHKDLPQLASTLHYRILDVSTIKELARRWYPNTTNPRTKSDSNHRALSDIKDSIAELKFYREKLFVNKPSVS